MNRRTFVASTAAAAILAFGGGASGTAPAVP